MCGSYVNSHQSLKLREKIYQDFISLVVIRNNYKNGYSPANVELPCRTLLILIMYMVKKLSVQYYLQYQVFSIFKIR